MEDCLGCAALLESVYFCLVILPLIIFFGINAVVYCKGGPKDNMCEYPCVLFTHLCYYVYGLSMQFLSCVLFDFVTYTIEPDYESLTIIIKRIPSCYR